MTSAGIPPRAARHRPRPRPRRPAQASGADPRPRAPRPFRPLLSLLRPPTRLPDPGPTRRAGPRRPARREPDRGPVAAASAAAGKRGAAGRALVGLGSRGAASAESGRQAGARSGPVHLPGVHLYRAVPTLRRVPARHPAGQERLGFPLRGLRVHLDVAAWYAVAAGSGHAQGAKGVKWEVTPACSLNPSRPLVSVIAGKQRRVISCMRETSAGEILAAWFSCSIAPIP